MPHQNTSSPKAVAQNAATPSGAPNDRAVEQNEAVHPEPSSYAARDVGDSTLAAPAAGEMADYADEGEPLDGEAVHQGRTHTFRPDRTEAARPQGPKTRAANRRIVKGNDAG
ncbi:hypothetical protein Q0812_05395 [Brevundimonas sp. 2R-24]|uniref:Uncharacterized protein n=1 Tax=Peiella sedimenti TaxID=3061083 RepID=A0ABT8SLJ8_9CAUL|nr:hypothetical protein [Caulobacteraceae bacterium XZ-24]